MLSAETVHHNLVPSGVWWIQSPKNVPLEGWVLLGLQHWSNRTERHQAFHLSWMSQNVTPDIRTKRAISTNQVARDGEINGILSGERVQFNIYSIRNLHSPDNLAHGSIGSAPLGRADHFSSWPLCKSWAGASGSQIGNIYLGLRRDWAQTFRVILTSGRTAREERKVCINIIVK